MSPPLSHRINVSTDSEELPKLDPLACDINYFDTFLEHKPLPVGPATAAPPPPPVKNSKIGTSSLGRKGKWRENSNNHECSPPASLGGLTSPPTASPNNCTSCRSPSQFPKVYIHTICFFKKRRRESVGKKIIPLSLLFHFRQMDLFMRVSVWDVDVIVKNDLRGR